jgi:L-lactate dehydrogenase complex protein LldF
MVEVLSPQFKDNAKRALGDEQLQHALRYARGNFILKRAKAVGALPEFDALRDSATAIKNHVLQNLDRYLEAYEAKVIENGGKVHWARDAAEARGHVLDICRLNNVQTVTKGKSMITEEIGLNDFLEHNGITPVETDLGEYIVQLRGEHPSHIIAPAVHLNIDQVREEFLRHHTNLPRDRNMEEPQSLLTEARGILREKFLAADMGITGANFLVAETGTSVIVTNEGNGDLTATLPKVHVVVASIEKVVPTLEDLSQFLRLLARSGTGQEMSVYTTLFSGPKREGDNDGPLQYHVILLDNGRSSMLGTEFQDMLRCIRCGACMNHCPVYQAIGGHAYGWVYPGPMGAVLTPQMVGIDRAGHLPSASTFCGRCESVCPMRIPLPKMMRHWREREFERHLTPSRQRTALEAWAWAVKRPRLYRFGARLAMRAMRVAALGSGRFSRLPFAGGWTRYRDFPAPQGATFVSQWRGPRQIGDAN